MAMTKSELIERVANRQPEMQLKDIDVAIRNIIENMSKALSNGSRVEVRGFGSFSIRYRKPRVGRNPKTGDSVSLNGKYVPHFKAGKELRDRINASISSVEIKDH